VNEIFNDVIKKQLSKVGYLQKQEYKRIQNRIISSLMALKKKYDRITRYSDSGECFQELMRFFESIQGRTVIFGLGVELLMK